jgi:hypothetical protein
MKSGTTSFFIVNILCLLFVSCKKQAVSPVLSPFEVRYEIAATAPWYFSGGFCNANYATGVVMRGNEELPAIASHWSKTVTITDTERPIYVNLWGTSPFYFAKDESVTIAIFINGKEKRSYTSKTTKMVSDGSPTVYTVLLPSLSVVVN